MHKLSIEGGYNVFIGVDVIAKILVSHNFKDTVFIIADKVVAKYHISVITNILKQRNLYFKCYVLNSREEIKGYRTVNWLAEKILTEIVTRNSTIIAFGGGVIGDIGGFLASILLRGIELIHIPTTLLAQTDSSIGGKNAVNSKNGKNLIGTFYNPSLVVSDIALLKTLDKKIFNAGMSEIIKHAIIGNNDFLLWIEENVDRILNQDFKTLEKLVSESCKIKSYFISYDNHELHNKRIFLNFGHTIGHALESASKYQFSHGEALSIGMLVAIKISYKLNLINSSQQLFNKIKNLLQKFNLPINISVDKLKILKETCMNSILSYIIKDKKNNTLILISGIEKPILKKNICVALLKEVLSDFLC